MSFGAKDLEPGCLYITIAVPKSRSSHFNPAEAYLKYPTSLRANFDPSTYETWCADTYDREEFDWGLYWHRNRGDGTWYGLRAVEHGAFLTSARNTGHMASGVGVDSIIDRMGMSMSTSTSTSMSTSGAVFPQCKYALIRCEMSQSPRLQSHVVGLIRVLHAPGSMIKELSSYLDWLAAHAAVTATRSFIWSTSLYLRTRRHITASPQDRVNDAMPAEFDITGFLWEALQFAYSEVGHGLGGQLPRPILVSVHGTDLLWKGNSASKGEKRRTNQRRGC